MRHVDERKWAKAAQHQKSLKQQARRHLNDSKSPMPLYAQAVKTLVTTTISQKASIPKLIIDKAPCI